MKATPSMFPKLLVIGLDGATFDVIEPWAATGALPGFARLLSNSAYGRLRSVPNMSPAWATFATGLNPANHGIFHAFGWSNGHRVLRRMKGTDCHGPTLWRMASDVGQRVIVLNVPFTYPAERVNGVLLAGADAPGVDVPGFSYPPGLDIGAYRIHSKMEVACKENRPEIGLADLYAVEECRTETLIAAMSRGDWNLAVIIYDIPDVIQHHFWHQMSAGTGNQRYAILECYAFIEKQIQRLMISAGETANLMILSDHGFGPICATADHLANWLIRQGFTRILAMAQRSLQQRLISDLYSLLRRHLSERHKDNLRHCLPGLRDRIESNVRFESIDWAATTAYAGISPNEVWINRRGREPRGIIAPGAEYEQVCNDVITALIGWRDPHTNKRRVHAAYRREEVYRGRYLDAAPDVTIEWDPEAAPPADQLEGNTSRFEGDHSPDGIFIASGSAVRNRTRIHDVSIADVAPTILHWLGVPMTEPMDGRVLTELFQSSKEASSCGIKRSCDGGGLSIPDDTRV